MATSDFYDIHTYTIDDLKILKGLGWNEDYGWKHDNTLSRKIGEEYWEFFYVKKLGNKEAKLYISKSVFGFRTEITFIENGQPIHQWRRRDDNENIIVEEVIGLCSGILENYFDGVYKPYRLDKEGNLLDAKP